MRDAQEQADWLEAALADLGLRRVRLVGHSFGGRLACNHAVRSPGRLASLTLLDPARTLGDFPAELLRRSALTTVPGPARWGRPAFFRWIDGGAAVPSLLDADESTIDQATARTLGGAQMALFAGLMTQWLTDPTPITPPAPPPPPPPRRRPPRARGHRRRART